MNVNISLIDYIGIIDNGIGVLLSLLIDDEQFELLYWFNKNNEIKITIEDKFYQFYDIKDIYEFEGLKYLIYYIDNNILPKKEDIFKEFKF